MPGPGGEVGHPGFPRPHQVGLLMTPDGRSGSVDGVLGGPVTSKLVDATLTMILVVVMLVAGLGVPPAQAADERGGLAADGTSTAPAISADGRFVAFASGANNLSAEDENRFTNVFVRDLTTNTTTLVSRQSAAAGGRGANGSSSDPAISADGRYVAFLSAATNLVPKGTRHSFRFDVYVRDLRAGTTRLASAPSRTIRPWGTPWGPRISADGRVVAFALDRNTLMPSRADLIVVRRGGRTRVIAAPPTPAGGVVPPAVPPPVAVTPVAPNAGSAGVTPSPLPLPPTIAGGFVKFNLAADGAHLTFIADGGFYVRDLASRHNKRLRPSGVAAADAPLTISADGRLVAFNDDTSGAIINTRTGTRRALGCDRLPETTCPWKLGLGPGRFISTCGRPVIAANRRVVACFGEDLRARLDPRTGLVTRSLITGRMACVLCASDETTQSYDNLALTSDGALIAYTADRPGQPSGTFITDVHVLDTRTGLTTLASRQNGPGA